VGTQAAICIILLIICDNMKKNKAVEYNPLLVGVLAHLKNESAQYYTNKKQNNTSYKAVYIQNSIIYKQLNINIIQTNAISL
jgi:hypothetical protein